MSLPESPGIPASPPAPAPSAVPEQNHQALVWVEPLLAGDRRALARVISRVENGGPAAQALLAALYGHTGQAHIVGITGAPGTGKSTLVNALAQAYRAQGLSVGILAVDPTSPFSGGALLGDRVRMRDLAGDPGTFIRSMATRGSLGGLAHATADAVLVLDAAGYDRILVETVGVGQAEIDIAGAAHTTVVVEVPGLGDEVQAIKAGVLEIADLFAVNKADREGADQTVMALRMMQGLNRAAGRPDAAGVQADGSWLPPILKTVALRGEGIEPLRQQIERHAAHLRESGQWARREQARAAARLRHVLRDALLASLLSRLAEGQMEELTAAIARRALDPYTAAGRLLAQAGLEE